MKYIIKLSEYKTGVKDIKIERFDYKHGAGLWIWAYDYESYKEFHEKYINGNDPYISKWKDIKMRLVFKDDSKLMYYIENGKIVLKSLMNDEYNAMSKEFKRQVLNKTNEDIMKDIEAVWVK